MVAHPANKASSPPDFEARAKALGPALRARSEAAAQSRRLPVETIEEMKECGLFRMLQPERYGGFESHPNEFFKAQIALGEACPSTAWVFGVVAVHSWQLSLFNGQAQEDVWAKNPSALISSSYAPVGNVEPAEGGFRLSGRWSFSSGCEHCDWVFVGSFVPTPPDAKGPDMRTFLLPRSDYRIEDTWNVSGLKATGSHDVVVEDIFVPEHRTHKLMDGFRCESPGNEINTAPLYRIPFGQIFVRSVSTTALGIAQGALDTFREIAAKKVATSDRSKVSEEPTTQAIVARAGSTLEELKLVLFRSFNEMMDLASEGSPIPLDRRLQFRYESALAVEKSREIVDELFTASGGRALFLDHPMQRYFQDIHAARAHYANNPDKPGRNLGGVQVGLRNKDFFV